MCSLFERHLSLSMNPIVIQENQRSPFRVFSCLYGGLRLDCSWTVLYIADRVKLDGNDYTALNNSYGKGISIYYCPAFLGIVKASISRYIQSLRFQSHFYFLFLSLLILRPGAFILFVCGPWCALKAVHHLAGNWPWPQQIFWIDNTHDPPKGMCSFLFFSPPSGKMSQVNKDLKSEERTRADNQQIHKRAIHSSNFPQFGVFISTVVIKTFSINSTMFLFSFLWWWYAHFDWL